MNQMRQINPKYLEKNKVEELKKTFISNKPFAHLELDNFFTKEFCNNLLEALSKQGFYFKDSDLFKLSQTNDLSSTKNKVLKEAYKFLASKEFIQFMESLTNLKLKSGKIDLAGSLYSDTNYLLCHDDQLEGRKIAFLIYLTDFKESEGGSLNLFSSKKNLPDKVLKKIIPKFNKFAFFEVSDISFHEVEEVIVDKQRLALGGWFHGKD